MADPRRWLLFSALAVALVLFAIRRGDRSVGGPHAPCLIHSDCGRSLRCYVVPNPDGLATQGKCVPTCVDDPHCEPSERCTITALGEEQLVPVKAGRSPGERVCLPGER